MESVLFAALSQMIRICFNIYGLLADVAFSKTAVFHMTVERFPLNLRTTYLADYLNRGA